METGFSDNHGWLKSIPGRSLFLVVPVALAVAVGGPRAGIAMSGTGPLPVSHPVVVGVSGEVAVKGSGQESWEKVGRGTLLLSGDVLRSGKDGRATIRFAAGSMELYRGSEVMIPDTGRGYRRKDIREIVVSRGSVLVDTSAGASRDPFLFKTVNVQGRTAESLLTVSALGEGSTINVYQGTAQVSYSCDLVDRTSALVPGTSVRVESGGGAGRILYFDPQPVLKEYQRSQIPLLDGATGTHVSDPGIPDPVGPERLVHRPGEDRSARALD